MIIAIEDILSELVVRKLIRDLRPDLSVEAALRKGGRTAIEARANELNRVAHKRPVLILVDLDRPEPCPADLIAQLIEGPLAPNLIFRVAVMEIESWILADRLAFATFLGVSAHRIPENTDALREPKELIASLARKSNRKEIREDLVPEPGGTAKVGRAYNPRISRFVESEWDGSRASMSSPSLRRTIARLAEAFR